MTREPCFWVRSTTARPPDDRARTTVLGHEFVSRDLPQQGAIRWRSKGLPLMTDSSSAPVDDISAFISKVGLFVEGLPGSINRWFEGKQNAHRRAALLEAYRRRQHWRKADIPKLRALGVCPVADRRLQRIESAKSPGRGVIRSYSPLDETLTTGIAHLSAYFDPATPPAKRSRAAQEDAAMVALRRRSSLSWRVSCAEKQPD